MATPHPNGASGASPRRNVPWWLIALAAIGGLTVLVALPRVVAILALVVLVAGIIILRRGMPRWLPAIRRGAVAIVTSAAGAVLLVAGVLGSVPSPSTPSSSDKPVGFLADSSGTTQRPEPEPSPSVVEQRTTETIPFDETTAEDPSLPRGQTAIATVGQNGQRVRVYSVTLLNGKEIGRELLSDTVTVAPVAQVTLIGTYDPPPEPAPDASGCDTNYADACVPIAGDVDCAWGSGNGPAYFDGVARVVGVDIYDLDRDGDGWACER